MAKKKNENTTSIGFEEVIWRAADKLRGNLNALKTKKASVQCVPSTISVRRILSLRLVAM